MSKYYLPILAAAVLAAGAGGYYVGTLNPQVIEIKGVSNIQNGIAEDADFSVFWETWKRIMDSYLKAEELKNQDLIYGASAGLVKSLEDPYSSFLNPGDSKKFGEDLSGNFSGIGAEIGTRNDFLVIIAPLKNSPAEAAGLLAGDKILKIDDKVTDGLSINEAVKLIRGDRGTKVTLNILRNGWEKPKEFSIVRDVINIPTVDWKITKDNIAHLQLFNFNDNAASVLAEAVQEILAKNPTGLVLDLRNNPGGFLEVGVAIAGWFLEQGQTVVTEEFRSGRKNVFNAIGNGRLKDTPLVLLLNQGSASASEILAGAIRDHRGVKIVGEKTFGKGTVQELQQLRDGSTLKITVAHWILPKGDLIEKNGLKPDFEVKLTDKDIEEKKDPQLEKAIEVLKSQL